MKISLPGTRSGNIEDRRGASSGLGGGFPLPIGALAGMGIPGIILIVAIIVLQGVIGGGGGGFGVNPTLPGAQAPAAGNGPLPGAPDANSDQVKFVSFVLDDAQSFWSSEFERSGQGYTDARLVLYTDATQTGCGAGSAQAGPFYCPADRTVYLDLSFFQELSSQFGAPGDFAQAYVIAHELGHHVQELTGVSEQVQDLTRRHPDDANELSVRTELQADCLAGVWGYSTFERGLLETGDLEEGLTAAASVGDDRLQRETSGRVNPDTFTHGTSEQRVKWFRRGFDSGDPDKCNTFSGDI